jgi:ATP-dependent Lon protease
MQKMKYQNPVILLDELDKIQNTSEGNAVISVLLHVLDKTQNNKFQDMYMPEIPIDLSNVFFILAMNDKENIDANLKSRLCFIDIEGYTVSDKIKIGTEFILPKVLNNLMFHNMDIIIDTETMKYIIEKYSNNEKGVRNLEKSITGICEKLNTIKYINNNRKNKKIKLSFMINDLVFPLKLTKNIIDKLGEE